MRDGDWIYGLERCVLFVEDETVRAEALRRFNELMKHNDETVCHTEIRLLCMREGVKEGDELTVSRTISQLMEKYETTTGAEKRRIIAAVGQARFPNLVRRILGFTLDGTVRSRIRIHALLVLYAIVNIIRCVGNT